MKYNIKGRHIVMMRITKLSKFKVSIREKCVAGSVCHSNIILYNN